tara:strand:- start:8263 stop:8376 length:114 start_codon:yes stop_codon:yes gene_type:complete
MRVIDNKALLLKVRNPAHIAAAKQLQLKILRACAECK